MLRAPAVITILFFLFSTPILAQRYSLDSLLVQSQSSVDTTRINSILRIADYYEGENLDSTLYYARIGLSDAIGASIDSLIGDAFHLIAIAHQKKSAVDSALYYYRMEEQIRVEIGDPLKLGNVYNNYGLIADESGDFETATERYIQALELYESIPDSSRMAIVNVNLGIIFKSQMEYTKALSNYKSALVIFESINDKSNAINATVTRGNIGSVLNDLGEYESSIKYSTQAEKEYINLGFPRYAAYPRSNIAISYDSLGNYINAEKAYRASLAIHKKHENVYEVANISNAWVKCLLKQGKAKEGLPIAKEALEAATLAKSYELISDAEANLAKVYAGLGNFNKAYQFQQKSIVGRDSIFQKDKTKTIFELQEKYNVAKKEEQLTETRAILAESQIKVQRQNAQIYGASGLALFLGLLGYVFYNQQRNKALQLQKENELQEAMSKIETQNRLNDQRLSISRDLHDSIGAQLTFVISSIENLKYGFDIKDDQLSSKLEGIGGFTKTTIGELRDTIWAMNKDAISIDDLKGRITNFIDQARSATEQTKFDFILDAAISPDMRLSSFQGMNVYRVIQEGVNNALKYSDAANILVRIDKRANGIGIKIEDNGKGFDIETVELGNGLSNMKKRVAELGSTLMVKSSDGAGTILCFDIIA